MKDLLKKPVTFEKVEFWAATAIYVFAVFILLGEMTNVIDSSNYSSYYIPRICRYTVYYISFILLNFLIIKSLINGQRIVLNLLFLFSIYVLASAALGATDTWLNDYIFIDQSQSNAYDIMFRQEFVFGIWILLILGFYTVLKNALQAILSNLNISFLGNKQVTQECVVALGFWLVAVFFFKMHYGWKAGLTWGSVLFYGIMLYWYLTYKIIPDAVDKLQQFNEYVLRSVLIVILFTPVIAIGAYLVWRRMNGTFFTVILTSGFNLLVVVFAWFLYQYRLKKSTELHGLKTALGRSSADLNFLRSQINPHFLFNALNTLYGTSLQENAERTAEGIQKLGDMMRFMLQENMQDKIALAREIDYLNNYIDLQKLRTQTSPDIIIQTEIDEQINGLEIAPMLLIPFVENAFKHGISLREPSHIKISLQTREKELLFDVYNSIHPKAGNDPEKNKSGIGLENVKQRLLLLYPKRHELVIRESAKEFFIHLTVKL